MGIQMNRRSTRDIAIAAEAKGDQHASICIEHHGRVERSLAEGKADRERMHAENKAEFSSIRKESETEVLRIHERIDKVDSKISNLPWKVVGGMAVLLMGFATITGWLLTNGGFLHLPK